MLKLRGKRVLVMGLGLLGGARTVTAWLCDRGARVTVTDLKSKKELAASVRALKDKKIMWQLGSHEGIDVAGFDVIVQNPGVPKDADLLVKARKKKIPIHNEASLFFLLARRPLIVVTGTRGKSTTATLLGEMLKGSFPDTIVAGNRGDVPMFSFVADANAKSSDPIVLELSSWHVEGLAAIKQSPKIGVLTNLYPDHLNRYTTLKEYYKAKEQLFAFQKKSDVAIINFDNKPSRETAKRIRSTTLWFSSKQELPASYNGVYKQGDALYYTKGRQRKRIVDLFDIALPGAHNRENLAAAALAARTFGTSIQSIHEAARTFTGIWGRQENLGIKGGIRFINDTSATTPEGLKAFIATYPSAVIIAGGDNKRLSYTDVLKSITKKKVKAIVFLPGSATDVIVPALKKRRLQAPPLHTVSSLPQAFTKALRLARKGDTIGLCPGATSFHQFANEFERGRAFEKLYKKL